MHQKNSCFCVRKLGIPPIQGQFLLRTGCSTIKFRDLFLDFQASPSSRILGTAHSTSKKKTLGLPANADSAPAKYYGEAAAILEKCRKICRIFTFYEMMANKKNKIRVQGKIMEKKQRKCCRKALDGNCWYCRAMVSCPTLHRKQSQVTQNWLASEPELTQHQLYLGVPT